MFRAFSIPISWTELLKRTVKETSADNCLGLAAQLAYYLLLALVPALVFVIALTSFLPAAFIQQTIERLAAVAPSDVIGIVAEQMRQIAAGQHGGVLTFGIAMALWSSSAAVVAITDALNRAYDIEEGRPWWKVRLTAILLTLALAGFVIVAFALVMAGPMAAEWVASRAGLGPAFEWTWKILQWPLVFALLALAIGFVNYFAPDAEQDWTWITPGAVLATLLWLLASLAFKFYVANFADYNETYGSLGGVIVLMLWLYISSLAILIGAEMNAEIEHASPYGKDPGEKVPGQKKKLGTAAARAYEARRRGEQAPRPEPARVPAPQAVAGGGNPRRYVPGVAMFLTQWVASRVTRSRRRT